MFIIFAEQDSHYNEYVTILMNSPGIVRIASQKIVDAPLALIVRMQQQVYRLPCLLKRHPIVYLWQ
jgi:hypothetical protein